MAKIKLKNKNNKVKKSKINEKHLKLKLQNKIKFKNKQKIEINQNLLKLKKKPKISSEENPDLVKKHDPSEIDSTLFVGNLASNTKKSQLKSLFLSYGKIKSIRFRTVDGKKIIKHKIRKDAETLNAYVVMENKESAEKALELSGTEFKGNHLRITKAKKSLDEIDPKRTIFIGNLKYSATDEKLYEIFSCCGEIEYVRVLRNELGCKGIAYVCFKKSDAVILALELNNTMLDERPIRVQRYFLGKLKSNTNLDENKKSVKKEITKINKSFKGKQTKTLKNNEKMKSSIKNQFRGVQTNKVKKKLKKKKSKDKTQILAKKIAPKSKV